MTLRISWVPKIVNLVWLSQSGDRNLDLGKDVSSWMSAWTLTFASRTQIVIRAVYAMPTDSTDGKLVARVTAGTSVNIGTTFSLLLSDGV